jgi:hypothetical protein
VAAKNLWIFSKDGTLVKKEPFAQKVVLTPNGRYVASSYGNIVYFYRTPLTAGPPDPRQLNEVWESVLPNQVRSIEITDDGSIIVAATEGNGVFIITTAIQKISSSNSFTNALIRISHDGSRIVGISTDAIHLYNTNAIVYQSYSLTSIAEPKFLALSQTVPLMVFNDGQKIRSFDASLGEELWNVRATGFVSSLAMTPSGSYIVVGTDNGNIDQYDDEGVLNWSYSSSNTEENLTAGIATLAISKDGARVAAGSINGNVLILDASGKLQGSYKAKENIRNIAMSNDGSIVLAAGNENIYAFTAGPSSSMVSYYQFDPKNLTPASLNTSGQNITTQGNMTQPSGIPPPANTSVGRTITEPPTTYSMIRTATQSPVSEIIPMMGILVALLLLVKRQ